MKYEDSWVFNMTSTNFSQFVVNASSKIYKKGTMVFLQPITGVVGLAETPNTIKDNDYLFNGDESSFSLTAVVSHSSDYQYVQLIVVTKRYYYENNQTISLAFNQPGVYNLSATVYDPLSVIVALQSTYLVNGDSFNLYFI